MLTATDNRRDRRPLGFAFWEQPTTSTRSQDGVLSTLVGEPAPIGPLQPSGLSRLQLNKTIQTVGVPAVPAYCGSQGGLVADRILLTLGDKKWWSTVSVRGRLQQAATAAWGRKADDRGAKGAGASIGRLVRPAHLGLCARGRAQLAPALTLNGLLEAESLGNPLSSVGGYVALRHRGASETLATIGGRRPGADAQGNYGVLPLAVSLDTFSRASTGLLYRAGLRVTSPESGDAPASPVRVTHGNGVAPPGHGNGAAVASDGHAAAAGGGKKRYVGTVQGAVGYSKGIVLWDPLAAPRRGGKEESASGSGSAWDYAQGKGKAEDVVPSTLPAPVPAPASSSEKMIPVTPKQVLDGLKDVNEALDKLRDVLSTGISDVQSGAFRAQLPSRRKRAPRSLPYNFIMGRPQVKLHVEAGIVGRIHPPAFAWGPLTVPGYSTAVGAVRDALPSSTRDASTRATLATLSSFGTIGLTAQAGKFKRLLADYTAFAAKLHWLASPPACPEAPTARRCFTASAAQQLLGPVVARVDARILPPSTAIQAGVQQASLLESVYSLEVAIPAGAGRVAVWYAPQRREGMLELRVP